MRGRDWLRARQPSGHRPFPILNGQAIAAGALVSRMPCARLARLAAAAAATRRRRTGLGGTTSLRSAVAAAQSRLAARLAATRPPTLLLAVIAKSLRKWHLSSRILSARSAWLTATAAANPMGAVNHDCPSNRPLRANMRRSGHIGVKPTGVAGAGWPRATPCGLLQYLFGGFTVACDRLFV